jgi:riboflavin transporter FmnP
LFKHYFEKGEKNMSTQTMTREQTPSTSKVRTIAQVGMLGAIAVVLMLFEIPLPFAPSFYEIDFSEVPVLIGCFAMGPVAGAMIELVKILLNFAINGTMTAGVGELANFLLGCSFVVPAGLIYRKLHTRKGAIIGMAAGTVIMTFLGCFLNAFVLLPAYGKAFGMPIEALVGMGTAVNAHITSLFTFVILAVAPFNILKGIIDSLIVFLIYKKIRPIFRMQQ